MQVIIIDFYSLSKRSSNINHDYSTSHKHDSAA